MSHLAVGCLLGGSAVVKQEMIAACNFPGGGKKWIDFTYNLEIAPTDFSDVGIREKVVIRDNGHILAIVHWKRNKFG